MIFPSLFKAIGIPAAIFILAASVSPLQANADVEKVIRDFFTAMQARDAAPLKRILGESLTMIEAKTFAANFGCDTEPVEDLLPPKGQNLSTMEVSSVKVDLSPTHPSVAVASFTLNIRFSKEQLAQFEAELKQSPVSAELRKMMTDGGLKASMFAMLARKHDGAWKLVCISIPS